MLFDKAMFRYFSACVLLAGLAIIARAAEDTRPNIVFILADDLGYRDIGAYGSRFYRTPAIDQIAQEGLKFSNAYASSPLCSPTRASIMTGQHPARHGITAPSCHGNNVVLTPYLINGGKDEKCQNTQAVTRLDTSYVTLAEVLRKAGYQTAHFGKWHLGRSPYSPLEHGFDIDVPHYYGAGPAGSYIAPWHFPANLGFQAPPTHPDQHLEDRVAREAVRYIRQRDKTRPFFLNYWAYSVHSPLDAKSELIDYYRTHPSEDPLDRQCNAVYAAMVQSLDQAVRTIVSELKEQGIYDDTILVITSDNGGVDWSGHPTTSNADKIYATDEELNLLPATCNLPLRSGKGTIYEGGIRVPLIMRGPGIIGGGTTTSAMVQSTDFFPTLVRLAGGRLPKNQAMDGVSFDTVLAGQSQIHRSRILTFFPHYTDIEPQRPAAAIRIRGFGGDDSSDWKLITFFYDGPGSETGVSRPHRYELYDLASLEGEFGNGEANAWAYPQIQEGLEQVMMTRLTELGALIPGPNSNYDDFQAWAWQSKGGSRAVSGGIVSLSGGVDGRYFGRGVDPFFGRVAISMRARSDAHGPATISWWKEGTEHAERVAHGEAAIEPEWQDLSVEMDIPYWGDEENHNAIRISFPPSVGDIQIDWIELRLYPGPIKRRWDY